MTWKQQQSGASSGSRQIRPAGCVKLYKIANEEAQAERDESAHSSQSSSLSPSNAIWSLSLVTSGRVGQLEMQRREIGKEPPKGDQLERRQRV